jgi:hypothetical protein
LQFACDAAISRIVSESSIFLSILVFEILLAPRFSLILPSIFLSLAFISLLYFFFSPCPDVLQMPNYRSLLGDATLTFPLLIHDNDEL